MPRTKKATPKPDAGGLILRAAALEFAKRGFAGARVDEIARRAGVNKAMLYYHVGDKAALYERVILDTVSAVEASLKEALAREETPEGKILALARVFETVAATRPYMPRIMLREMALGGRDLPAPAIEAFGRIILLEDSVLKEAARSGHFRPADVLSFHILMVGGTMLHIVSRGVRERIRGVALPDLPEPSGSAAEAVTAFLLEGLRSRTRADSPKPRPRNRSARPPAASARRKENRS
jgi:TetR/AcrR family transcriptional regulator